MDDLISRKKLLEQTAEWEAQALAAVEQYDPRNGPEERDQWLRWSYILKERGAFKKDVENAPTAEPQWISCEERLPNETEPWPVLCWIDDPLQNQIVGNPCYHDASYTGYSVVDGYGNVIARNCLAWMLLPESYKGGVK